jgi:hemolysin III
MRSPLNSDEQQRAGRSSMVYGERFNSISHLAGAVLAAAGALALIHFAAHQGDAWKIVSFAVFGATMVLLYVASTLYHSTQGKAKERFAKFDYCAIYLLIAGTYTPFALVTLRGAWGWALFGVIWALALLGIARVLFGRQRVKPSAALYVAMGWLGVVAAVPLIERLHQSGLFWLVFGGVLYSVGVLFYANDYRIRHGHGIWHLFVLGGTASHYFTVLYFV